jgi:peptidoglycan/LPS O-acetylase OafA/YrhL
MSTSAIETEPASRTRPYYPALDGLRAVAFLAVFVSHYGPVVSTWPALRGGWIGVDVFFVLSGFLITGILYDDLGTPQYFRRFYIRRALRILPLFYGFWLLLAVLTPLLGIVWTRYNFATVAYVGNYFSARALAGRHADPGLLLCRRLFAHGGAQTLDLVPLWSLCIEEQFYLVWPAVVAAVRSRRKLMVLCFVVIGLSPLLRGLYWRLSPATAQHGATYFNTLTRLDGLLLGGAIALWLRGARPPSAVTLRRVAYPLLMLPLPVLGGLIVLFSPNLHAADAVNWINDPVVNTIGLSLVALFSAGLLLLAIQPDSWVYRVLHVQPLLAIGRRSYGLYFLHAVPLLLFAGQLLPRLQQHHLGGLFIPAALLYTFAAGWLSYRYLESPFLNLKSRFPHPKPRVTY